MAYDTAARSRAAKNGWVWRRALAGRTVTPEWVAHRRLGDLLRHGDPCALRILACDLAEGVLHRYAEYFPGDVRPALAIQVARRYATGDADDKERLAAHHLACTAVWACERMPGYHHHHPAYAAASAAGFCLEKPAGAGLRCAAYWATHAAIEDAPYGLFSDGHIGTLLPAVEARLGTQQAARAS